MSELRVSTSVQLLVLLWLGHASAEEIIVNPAGGTTIQQAVDGASDGDVITLADGVFLGAGNRGIDFRGKAITLRSQSGVGSVIIDCGEEDNAFRFMSGETRASIVEGITIENGSSATGAGIFIRDASPTIRDCVLRNCISDGNGGGIYIKGIVVVAAPSIEDCEISGCRVGAGHGGGIFILDHAEPSVSGCVIWGNRSVDGGGIYLYGVAGLSLRTSTIHSNVGFRGGGGLFALQGMAGVNVERCVFYNNTAYAEGGGIGFLNTSNATVTNCTIAENVGRVGGVYVDGGSATFVRTIIANNTAIGAYCTDATVTVEACMLVGGNSVSGDCFNGVIIEQSPQFCGGPESRDYRLQSDSPAAGNFDGCPDILGAVTELCGTTATRKSSWSQLKAAFR